MEFQEIIKDIAEWQRKTFPASDDESKYHHLREETRELWEAMAIGIGLGKELADCVILLIGIADNRNIDIQKEIIDKMKINKNRIWGEPNPLNIYHHIPEEKKRNDKN